MLVVPSVCLKDQIIDNTVDVDYGIRYKVKAILPGEDLPFRGLDIMTFVMAFDCQSCHCISLGFGSRYAWFYL